MARCHIHPEKHQHFVDQVSLIIPLVRAEPGCSRYELHSDPFEPGLFIFCEEWESQKHLDDHLATPHMQEYFSKTADWMTAAVELILYEISGVQTVRL